MASLLISPEKSDPDVLPCFEGGVDAVVKLIFCNDNSAVVRGPV